MFSVNITINVHSHQTKNEVILSRSQSADCVRRAPHSRNDGQLVTRNRPSTAGVRLADTKAASSQVLQNQRAFDRALQTLKGNTAIQKAKQQVQKKQHGVVNPESNSNNTQQESSTMCEGNVVQCVKEYKLNDTECGTKVTKPRRKGLIGDNKIYIKEVKHTANEDLIFDRNHKGVLIRLGKGAFGFVYQAKYRGMPVAVKTCIRKLAISETKALRSIKSLHICRLFRTVHADQTSWMILERAEMSLETVVSHRGCLSRESVQYIASCVVLALEDVHNAGWIHLDIKLHNILLNKHGKPKLCDFGSARPWRRGLVYLKESCYPAGSPGYWAPEIVRGEPFDVMADWFSLGVCLYKLTSGRLPWLPNDLEMLYRVEGEGQIDFDGECFDDTTKDIIEQFLRDDPVKRLGHSVMRIRAHSWFRGVLWGKLERGRGRPTKELMTCAMMDV